MDQFGLQFLQPRLILLALCKVADETGKKTLIAGLHFAVIELEWERRTVPALADDNPADADDSPLASFQIAQKITVVTLSIGRWHQHLDVLAENLGGAI